MRRKTRTLHDHYLRCPPGLDEGLQNHPFHAVLDSVTSCSLAEVHFRVAGQVDVHKQILVVVCAVLHYSLLQTSSHIWDSGKHPLLSVILVTERQQLRHCNYEKIRNLRHMLLVGGISYSEKWETRPMHAGIVVVELRLRQHTIPSSHQSSNSGSVYYDRSSRSKSIQYPQLQSSLR